MKKLIYLLLLPFIAFMGCNDDDDGYSLDNYRVDIATVENPQNEAYFYLVRDNGVRLWVTATLRPNYRPKSGQRVLVDYTLLNDRPAGSAYNHDVRLNDAYNILTKDIVELTESNEEMIGDDPLGIRSLWIGSDYLNVRFYYGGYNKTHYINLVIDESQDYNDGKVHLELRHNANEDASTYRYNGIVSFDMESLREYVNNTLTSIELVIHVNEYDNANKTYNVTYKFNEDNISTESFDRDEFSNSHENNID